MRYHYATRPSYLLSGEELMNSVDRCVLKGFGSRVKCYLEIVLNSEFMTENKNLFYNKA